LEGFKKTSKIIVFRIEFPIVHKKVVKKRLFPKSPISNRKLILVIFQKIPFFRLFFVQIYTLKKTFFGHFFLEFFCSKKLFLGMSRNFDQFFIFLKKMCFQSGEDKIFLFFLPKKIQFSGQERGGGNFPHFLDHDFGITSRDPYMSLKEAFFLGGENGTFCLSGPRINPMQKHEF